MKRFIFCPVTWVIVKNYILMPQEYVKSKELKYLSKIPQILHIFIE